MTCVCPHTVATPAVLEAISRGGDLPQALRDPPLGLDEVADAVIEVVTDEWLAGRTVRLRGGEAARLER